MALGDGLVALLFIGFWLFCLFDVITTDEAGIRNLAKIWWVLIVLFFTVIGSVMWLVAGRPQGAGAPNLPSKVNRPGARGGGRPMGAGGGHTPTGRTMAPDDDPEFLERVRQQNDEDKDLLRRWEEDLRRREDELRKHHDDEDEPPTS